ncbi:Uma2 family endonuclease [Synechococcus sp. J7-Johnson]|uniref:Uma2 family endonuclease n=1 Tax=Synechococcus sp. J7-Johnson TaxID=2823737 RepID=UPI0020CD224C|nr:Uma2 family endonuclease [Synechococcus sp. J7-Johnson]MCP9841763.1 Uma2 family endonuclease [Synechococcus sp. J7-Johnson]
MTIAAQAANAASAIDALAPLRLPTDIRLTPEQFERVCAQNPEAVLELGADGQVIQMTPTGSETGARNSRLVMRLLLWADQQGGWKVFDSSSGFRLPDGSVLSPDASLVSLQRWRALPLEQRRGFAPLCPDLVVELASPSDEGPRGVTALRRKMAAYQANGARLGWLLLPDERAVEIWPASVELQRIEQADELAASPEFPGLRLELAEIWAG